MKHPFRIAIGLGVIALLAAVVLGVGAVRVALTAESHLHAMLNVVWGCQAYVEQSGGDWPSSWEEVEPLLPDERDWREREVVTIDFAADPAELAKQDWQTFTGIVVEDPVYPSYEGQLRQLITLLQEHHPITD